MEIFKQSIQKNQDRWQIKEIHIIDGMKIKDIHEINLQPIQRQTLLLANILFYYIDTDKIPGFFHLQKNHIFTVRSEDTTRERYFHHSKIKFVSPRGHVISSISIYMFLYNNPSYSCILMGSRL